MIASTKLATTLTFSLLSHFKIQPSRARFQQQQKENRRRSACEMGEAEGGKEGGVILGGLL
jgi:hypothetical protein